MATSRGLRQRVDETDAGGVRDDVGGGAYGRGVASLDDIRALAATLPGSEETASTGGAAWLVRRKVYAWECRPWPSVPDDVREILARELVVAVKIADPLGALALREMDPGVFLPHTTRWGEPKVAFRMAAIDLDHLGELVTEAWRVQAPKYLRAEFDGA